MRALSVGEDVSVNDRVRQVHAKYVAGGCHGTVVTMEARIAVYGGSPTWRRGMVAVCTDAGFTARSVGSLDEWEPADLILVCEPSAPGLGAFQEDHPHLPVVLVVPRATPLEVARALRRGAAGVLTEDDPPEIVAEVLTLATSGRISLPWEVVAGLAEIAPDVESAAQLVSAEERGWLRAMASGRTVAEIADGAGYSERAMFRQLRALYLRIGVSNRTEALLWAGRVGLIGELDD